MQKLKLEEIIG